MRLVLLLLALFWGTVGATFMLVSVFALSLFFYPCLIGDPLCTTLVPQIIQQFFFGRLPVSTLRTLLQILTLLVFFISLLSLYITFVVLRFMIHRNNAVMIFSLIHYNLLFLVFLGVTYGISWRIDPWLDYVERGCPSGDIQLCVSDNGPLNDELRLEKLSMYREWLSTGRSTALVTGGLLLILTIFLWLVRKLPVASSRSNNKKQPSDTVCALCGLESEQPHCVLCQPYIRVETGVNTDSIWIRLIPIRKNVPVEQPVIEGKLKGFKLEASQDQLEDWKLKNQRGHFTLSPVHTEFISDEIKLELLVTRTNRGNNRSVTVQLKPRGNTYLYNYNRNWPEHQTQITVDED